MKPPICSVCGAAVEEPGRLVHLPSTPEAVAWHERAERDHIVGHPPDLEWRCAVHLNGPSTAIRAIGVSEFGTRLRQIVPAMAELLGVAPPVLSPTTVRQWHPMDGAVAPECPYTDDTTWTASDSSLTVSGSRAWWAEGRLARAHEMLTIRTPEVSASLAGHIPADGSTDQVSELVVLGALPPAVARLVVTTFSAVA